MIIYSKVTEAPNQEPITLDEAKAHLKIELDITDEDLLVTSLVKTARRLCEIYTGLSFFTQVRQMKLDRFPYWRTHAPAFRGLANWRRHDGIIVPYGPVQSIDSIKYILGGAELTLDPSAYTQDLHSDLARLFPVDVWPDTDVLTPNAITIKYTAGYDSVSGEMFPEQAKVAMLLTIGSLYEGRQDEGPEAMHKLDWNSEKILDSIKVYWNADQD